MTVPPANEALEAPEKPLTTGEWFVTLLVLALPIVGLVMYFVWGFGTGCTAGIQGRTAVVIANSFNFQLQVFSQRLLMLFIVEERLG